MPATGHDQVSVEAVAAVSGASGGERLAHLDNLKTLLIAGVIAAHAVMGYSDFGSWTYQDVQEVTLSPVVETIFVIATVAFGGMFMMGLLFLLSGLMTEHSLARKGSRRFVIDRLLRLGIPFALYTLVIWPLLEFALLEPFFHRGSYWEWFTDTEPVLDNGPMWFVGVLLLFSLVLVAWRRRFPPQPGITRPLAGRDLARLAIVVGVATFAVRIVFPADTDQLLNAHLWAWPEYLAMFGLGVLAARRGWLRPVPASLSRQVGIATIVVIVILPIAILTAEPLGLSEDAYLGGWSLPALLGGLSEGVIAITAPIWVLGFAQRRLDGTGRLRRSMARSSYAAFMLQGPVLVGLELLIRPVDLSGDLKALIVATLGIAVSFALAWQLVTRTPLRRVL
ncbi:MAG: acyltransferase [Acidimicrobiia bacterium]|nr:acyltransferase [Acidimicrobiia bacterium]